VDDIEKRCVEKSLLDKSSILPGELKLLSDQYMMQQSDAIRKKYFEELAIFDKNGERIGEGNWYFVNRFGYIYSAFSALLIDGNDLLLQKRSQHVNFPGMLDCAVGGAFPSSVDSSESRLKHVRVEASEEIFSFLMPAIDIKFLHQSYYEVSYGKFNKRLFSYLYVIHLKNKRDRSRMKGNWEVESLQWIDKSEIMKMDRNNMAPGLVVALSFISDKGIIL